MRTMIRYMGSVRRGESMFRDWYARFRAANRRSSDPSKRRRAVRRCVVAAALTLPGLLGLLPVVSHPVRVLAAATKPGQAALAAQVSDPVIAVAGDIACDPSNTNFDGGNGSANSCRQL